jgi:MFS family permease
MFTYLGMSFGSVGWGVISDAFGRRFTFNSTLLLTGVFGVLISFGPTYAITTFLFACMGIGVGGNLPVDGALFLEFLPMADNKLLTLLSAWWPAGQLVSAIGLSTSCYSRLSLNSSIVAWYFIPRYSCEVNLSPCSSTGGQQPCCDPSNNRGWRYFIAVLGLFTLLMFVCRVVLFKLLESPKFLLSRNRQREAIGMLQWAMLKLRTNPMQRSSKRWHNITGRGLGWTSIPSTNSLEKTGQCLGLQWPSSARETLASFQRNASRLSSMDGGWGPPQSCYGPSG